MLVLLWGFKVASLEALNFSLTVRLAPLGTVIIIDQFKFLTGLMG